MGGRSRAGWVIAACCTEADGTKSSFFNLVSLTGMELSNVLAVVAFVARLPMTGLLVAMTFVEISVMPSMVVAVLVVSGP